MGRKAKRLRAEVERLRGQISRMKAIQDELAVFAAHETQRADKSERELQRWRPRVDVYREPHEDCIAYTFRISSLVLRYARNREWVLSEAAAMVRVELENFLNGQERASRRGAW